MSAWPLCFSLLFGIQLAYWVLLRTGFRRAQLSQREADAPLPPLSVVVAARNEEHTLPTLLAALARQTHPAFEVVIVDDASTDATPHLVERWAAHHPNVRLLRVTEPVPPRKKHALALGIAAARHDLLVLTDADCVPPPTWLEAMARQHGAAGAVLLIGYSPYRRGRGLLNRLARYETFVTGFLTAAAVGLGRPYMAVGRNLSYPRPVFQRIGGFAHSRRSLSGDDDLLVQEVARRRAATIRHVFAPSTFVLTDAPPTWRAWLRQKKRHASAGRFYTTTAKVHLALFQASGAALWLAPLFAGWFGAGLLAARLLVQARILHEAARTFQEDDLIAVTPVLELLYAAYNAAVVPLGLMKVPERW